MTTTMPTFTTIGPAFVTEDQAKAKGDELTNYLKVCRGKSELLFGLTTISMVDGWLIEPECCVPAGKELCYAAARECVRRIILGCGVNGKDGNFSNGCFGSRWMDLNVWARANGLTHVRCAFYSKKFSENWAHDTPYSIQVTIEKAR
jgi:hypothetical protein